MTVPVIVTWRQNYCSQAKVANRVSQALWCPGVGGGGRRGGGVVL